MAQQNRIIYEEDRKIIWTLVQQAMSRKFNKEELIKHIGLNKAEFKNFRSYITVNQRQELTAYFYDNKMHKTHSKKNKKLKLGDLTAKELLATISEKKLSRTSAAQHYNVCGTALYIHIKKLDVEDQRKINAVFKLNSPSTMKHSKLPPNTYKRYSNFEMKETNKNTILPIGVKL